jgi:hypothetical protein
VTEPRPLYELDHGSPWGREDLPLLAAVLAGAVLVAGLLALAIEA